MESVNKIHKIRVDIDYIITQLEEHKKSAESTLALRSCQMAKAWLGKVLEKLGEESPYKVVSNPSEIPPTADKAVLTNIYTTNYIEGYLHLVNQLRDAISLVIKDLAQPSIHNSFVTGNLVEYSFMHLTEARFWLGFELANIRENKIKYQ